MSVVMPILLMHLPAYQYGRGRAHGIFGIFYLICLLLLRSESESRLPRLALRSASLPSPGTAGRHILGARGW